jgi:Protein of unknown function (DUF4232)
MRWTYVAGMIPVTALAVAAVAGCSSSTTPSSGASASATATATGTAGGAATPSSSPASGSGGNSPAAASGTPACTTGDLKATLGSTQGAAGSIYVNLDLTNTSSSPCTLYGYPGTSLANASTSVSPGADRSSATPESLVTLDAGSTGHAVMQIADAGNYSSSTCGPKPTSEIKIYPPNQTAALYVTYSTSACTKSVHQLGISAVPSGS